MRYNEDTCTVELSVRSLCETALHGGDLGSGSWARDLSALADGGKVHRRLQAEAGGFYQPEVSLSLTTSYEGIFYTVSGRADGVIRTDRGLMVDEIKCVHRYDFYRPPKDVFLAQLKCYAYFLLRREELSEIKARLTYYEIESEKIRYFTYRFTAEELKRDFEALIRGISRRAALLVRHETEERPTAAHARFPYRELREGQEQMVRACYSAIRRGKRLFVEAPTGTGKTISALYPAVRALGEGRVDKIFYLTAKGSTRREAYRAAAELHHCGTRLRTVVITAKEQCCNGACRALGMGGRSRCNGRDCPNARGYYDRSEEALFTLLREGYGYPAKRIAEVAKAFSVCPYELSLDLSELCDIVICDYNYVFDPSVYFRRYFGADGVKGKYVLLMDEAHNLPDRARSMYSATLCRSAFETLLTEAGEAEGELCGYLQSALRGFLPLHDLCRDTLNRDAEGREQGFYATSAPLSAFDRTMESFCDACDGWLRKHEEHPLADAVSRLFGAVRRFLLINEYFEKGFLTYVQILQGEVSVQSCCLDPSAIMNRLLDRGVASVFFSATMTPWDYYGDLLGGSKHAEFLSLPSPFDSKNLCVAVANYVTTRFETRSENISRFATVIAATVSARPGNYIAYFPSYTCLEEVRKVFVRKYPKVEIVVQERSMGASEREAFLSAFVNDTGHLRVGFCVLGGAFSEGVDLPGSRLIGAIVFGTGLPGLSNERNMIRDYADPDGMDGYDIAYTFPGMNRVLQAAGRVIRRDDDRGVVVLADARYAEPKLRALLPAHWKGIQYAGNARSLAEIIKRFWHEGDLCE